MGVIGERWPEQGSPGEEKACAEAPPNKGEEPAQPVQAEG